MKYSTYLGLNMFLLQPMYAFVNTHLKSRNVCDADSPRLLTTMAFKLKSLLQTEFRNGFQA